MAAEDRSRGAAVDLILSAGVFVGALLLFQVQPMIGKYILPWFGGSPSVWTICLLFFQVFLLAGYLYAHLLVTRFRPSAQAVIHAVLAAGALLTLPVIPADHWKPTGDTNPTVHILLLLVSTIGLPYLILSGTGPLLQSWFGTVRPDRSPYRLYALSNAASLAALLSYPLLFEPLFSRHAQAIIWSIGFVLYALVVALCAAAMRSYPLSPRERVRVRVGGTNSDECGMMNDEGIEADSAISIADPAFGYSNPHPGPLPEGEGEILPSHSSTITPHSSLLSSLLWLALPACATTLLMATTNTLCQEVAVIPFLWVAPLSVYLLSFIISFDSPRWYHRGVFVPLMFAAIGVLCWVMLLPVDSVGLIAQVAVYTVALFVCCMACHGELYRLRPHAGNLTGYYLHIAAGGAIGGIFVAVIAPVLFNDFSELQLGLGATVLLVLAVLFVDPQSPMHRGRNARGWRFSIGGAILLGIGLTAGANRHVINTETIERTRNFHGVLTVYAAHDPVAGKEIQFHHAGITHGIQFVDPTLRKEPTAYYGRTSGIGRMLAAMAGPNRKIGLVGQGVGTLAAYGRAGDVFRSYELNPEVDRLARKYFTFIADCAGTFTTYIGDARLNLEREPDQAFDLLALDAFSGDAIPVHLLTREAFDLYARHLKPHGVIAVHISNLHLDLSPVVFAQAERLGMSFAEIIDPGDDRIGCSASQWILMSRDATPFDWDAIRPASTPVARLTPARMLWTDDHSSLLPLLR